MDATTTRTFCLNSDALCPRHDAHATVRPAGHLLHKGSKFLAESMILFGTPSGFFPRRLITQQRSNVTADQNNTQTARIMEIAPINTSELLRSLSAFDKVRLGLIKPFHNCVDLCDISQCAVRLSAQQSIALRMDSLENSYSVLESCARALSRKHFLAASSDYNSCIIRVTDGAYLRTHGVLCMSCVRQCGGWHCRSNFGNSRSPFHSTTVDTATDF